MPRIRTLKPEALQHRKVGRLSDRAFRLWIAMITQADDHGRLRVDYEQFRILIWGFHQKVKKQDVQATLDELTRAGLVRDWITPDSEHFAYFPSWADHQRVQHPSPSLIPDPPFHKEAIPGDVRVALAERYGIQPGETGPVKCHYCDAVGSAKWWLTARGKPSAWVSFSDLEMDHLIAESAGGSSTADNIVLACRKCNRSKGTKDSGTFTNVTVGSEGIGREGKGSEGSGGVVADAQFLDSLRSNPAYDGIDIDRELGKMDAWLSTPKGRRRQKTRQFIVNWLNGVDRPIAAENGQPIDARTAANLDALRRAGERLKGTP